MYLNLSLNTKNTEQIASSNTKQNGSSREKDMERRKHRR